MVLWEPGGRGLGPASSGAWLVPCQHAWLAPLDGRVVVGAWAIAVNSKVMWNRCGSLKEHRQPSARRCVAGQLPGRVRACGCSEGVLRG
jgi:hypothetical protein